LFNVEILKIKIAEAKEVLEAGEDDGVVVNSPPPVASSPSGVTVPAPEEQERKTTTPAEAVKESAIKASSGGDAAAAAGSKETTTSHTLASLAKLPASEIVRLASTSTSDSPSSPLLRPDPAVAKDIDDFVDGLQGKPPHEQKQKLGERLFKVVKSFGIKNSVSCLTSWSPIPYGRLTV
jgi:polyadenylate-binding protein